MVIHPREHDLVLGTHGRGVYIIDDISTLRQLTPEVLESEFVFLDQRDPVPMVVSGQSWPGLDDEFVARNPISAIPITFYMKKRHLIGKMSMEIFDMDGMRVTEIPLVTRKGINQVFWNPIQKPPRPPISEAIPFQMQIALIGGGMSYPAGDYRIKVTKKDQVFEKNIRIYNNPDLPYTDKDREMKRKYQKIGFYLMEDLAYLDRQITEVLKGIEGINSLSGISSSTQKNADQLKSSMESIRDRMMVTQYGDLRGDSRLREDVGFLYGTIAFYGGRPTQVQMDRMMLLEKRVRTMEKEVDQVIEDSLDKINKGITKAGGTEIATSTREAFDAEVK